MIQSPSLGDLAHQAMTARTEPDVQPTPATPVAAVDPQQLAFLRMLMQILGPLIAQQRAQAPAPAAAPVQVAAHRDAMQEAVEAAGKGEIKSTQGDIMRRAREMNQQIEQEHKKPPAPKPEETK